MVSYLDINPADYIPEVILPGQNEVELEIKSAEIVGTKADDSKKQIKTCFEIKNVCDPQAAADLEQHGEILAPLFEYFQLPHHTDDPRKANNKRGRITKLIETFNLPFGPDVDIETAWPGATGFCVIQESNDTDSQYGPSNKIKSFCTPK